jgi:hypothetical protein
MFLHFNLQIRGSKSNFEKLTVIIPLKMVLKDDEFYH